ncbi:DNA polymerase III subunit delta' [Secundilactobacillus muriivasis]
MTVEVDSQLNTVQEATQKQPVLAAHFMRLVATQRLSHAYLLAGQTGCGKRAVAQMVAMRLFCEHPTETGEPCGTCAECHRILSGDHPDVVMVQPDGQRIKVDQVRYIKDEFAKSPVEGAMKVFIIEGTETLTTSAANGLLKFIEEPVDNRVIFLLTTNKSLILPTIQSRAQVVEFSAIPTPVFAQTLRQQQVSENQIGLVSALTNSETDAMALVADNWVGDLQHELARWYGQLAKQDPMAFVTVQTGLVPLATDRNRQSVVLDALIVLWQTTLRLKYQTATETPAFPELIATMTTVAQSLTQKNLLAILTAALATKKALAGNLNFQTILETLTLNSLNLLAKS